MALHAPVCASVKPRSRSLASLAPAVSSPAPAPGEAEQIVSDIVAATSHWLAYVDPDLHYRWVNPAYARRFDATPHDFIGRPLCDVLGSEAFEHARRITECARTGGPVRELIHLQEPVGASNVLDVTCIAHRRREHLAGYLLIVDDPGKLVHARTAIAAKHARLAALVDTAPDMIHVLSAEGRILHASANAFQPPSSLEGGANTVFDCVHGDDLMRVASVWRELLGQPGAVASTDFRAVMSDGSAVCIECVARNLLDDPEVGAIVLSSRDVTAKRQLADLEHDRARILELIVRNAPLGDVVQASEKLIERQAPGSGARILLPQHFGAIATPTDLGTSFPVEYSDGTQVGTIVLKGYAPLSAAAQAAVALASQLVVLAIERFEIDAELAHHVNHDTLTGLPNRVLFAEHLRVALARAERNDGRLALMLIDLDGFKRINDTLGHVIGDELLRQAARRLASCTRASDTLARMGGDEFMLLAIDLHDEAHGQAVASRLRNALSAPFVVDGRELFVTASIGISTYPGDGQDGITLLRHADAAMYRAKEEGKNGIEAFRPELLSQAAERLELEAELRHALARRELTLHFQPQIDLRTGAVTGIEALARWVHPRLGNVPPARFIPVAEETGLIIQLGTYVLEEACRQCVGLNRQGHDVRVAVNVSAVQFGRRDFLDTVISALQTSGLDPSRLELEVTESVLMRDASRVSERLTHLRNMGVHLAIDDFGTGYSSLAYLQKLSVDRLKIDRTFLMHVGTGDNGRGNSLVRSLVELAHSLGLAVTAEGVEVAEQVGFLRQCGCEEAQGYYFARPVPLEALDLKPRNIETGAISG